MLKKKEIKRSLRLPRSVLLIYNLPLLYILIYNASRNLAHAINRQFGNRSAHMRNVETTATGPLHLLYYYGFLPFTFYLTLCLGRNTNTQFTVYALSQVVD